LWQTAVAPRVASGIALSSGRIRFLSKEKKKRITAAAHGGKK